MARTVAGRRQEPAGKPMTGQEVLDKLMTLRDIYGDLIDGPRAMRLLAICNQHGIKAEALYRGMVTIHLVPGGYTLEGV